MDDIRRRKSSRLLRGCFLTGALRLRAPLRAQTSGGIDLSCNTIDGSGVSSNGGVSISGTIGQLDAGVPTINGTPSVTGGF
jgi:hypothetical protein